MTGIMTRFGQVEFHAARGRLSVAGRPVQLDRASAAILSALLDGAGREVHKDHLLEAGWPGRVVHENSLTKAIGRLRQALGEDGDLLETVHGYGYRLAAEPGEETSAAPTRGVPRRWFQFAGVGAGAIALAAVAGTWLNAYAEEPPLLRGEPADAIGRVLWVDDHPENNARERRFLEGRKVAVYQVMTSEEALSLLAMYEYRAVISDMNRAGRPLEGLALVREMRRREDTTPFFLYTVVPSAAQRAHVAQAGGQGAAVTPAELYAAILPLFGESVRRGAQ